MGTGWVWKRVSEKGPAKKQYHVSQEGSPEECLNLSLSLPVWKVEQERNRCARIQKGMVWLPPAWAMQDAEEEQKDWRRKETVGQG